jgi:hypothetical protein
MEHVVPRSKGGATEWRNVVLADKRINNLRGNRSLKEAGLTLKIQPRVPPAKPFHEKPSKQAQVPGVGVLCEEDSGLIASFLPSAVETPSRLRPISSPMALTTNYSSGKRTSPSTKKPKRFPMISCTEATWSSASSLSVSVRATHLVVAAL